jgi:hypothetical protein
MDFLKYLDIESLDKDLEFSEAEFLFRRCFPKENQSFPNEFFTATRSQDFIDGLSLNRSKYCEKGDHVCYNIFFDDATQECVYQHKIDSVSIECQFGLLEKVINKDDYVAQVKVEHDPIRCNYSHTILLFDPIPKTKLQKLTAKTFLTNMFRWPDAS